MRVNFPSLAVEAGDGLGILRAVTLDQGKDGGAQHAEDAHSQEARHVGAGGVEQSGHQSWPSNTGDTKHDHLKCTYPGVVCPNVFIKSRKAAHYSSKGCSE